MPYILTVYHIQSPPERFSFERKDRAVQAYILAWSRDDLWRRYHEERGYSSIPPHVILARCFPDCRQYSHDEIVRFWNVNRANAMVPVLRDSDQIFQQITGAPRQEIPFPRPKRRHEMHAQAQNKRFRVNPPMERFTSKRSRNPFSMYGSVKRSRF